MGSNKKDKAHMSIFGKKNFLWFIAFGIIALYFFTRLYNILGLPIFTDEAIYVRWMQIAENDPDWLFISLTDGKQPLFIWAGIPLLNLFSDPLFAARMVSVFAGFFSLIGIFFLASELFNNKKLGLLASFLYALFPFALVYDRIALYDSMVATFVIWGLYLGVLLVRYLRIDIAIGLGVVAGLGMLAKTSANFGLILLPFSLVLFDWKDKKRNKKLLKWGAYAILAVIIANVIYQLLRLSPFFYIVAEKNLLFIYSPEQWIKSPFAFVFNNSRTLFEWVATYLTVPFLILVAASFFVTKKYLPEKLFLLACFIVPFFSLSFFGKLLYPRYLLFMTMPLLILGSFTLYHLLLLIKNIWLKGIVIIVFTAMFVVTDYFIITDFVKASVPKAEKGQFITDWPGGVGVRETIAYLSEKAKDEKIYVGTGGTFGLMPYALEIYLHDNPNITIKGFWPVESTPPKEVLEAAKKMPTYFVMYQGCPSCPETGIAPSEWKAESVLEFERIEPDSFYNLYEIKRNEE